MSSAQFDLEKYCQECGKPREVADEVVPEMAGWHVMHGLTGRWTCGECCDLRERGEV